VWIIFTKQICGDSKLTLGPAMQSSDEFMSKVTFAGLELRTSSLVVVKLAGCDKFEKYEFGFGQNVTEYVAGRICKVVVRLMRL
jgi:hypothetical protein